MQIPIQVRTKNHFNYCSYVLLRDKWKTIEPIESANSEHIMILRNPSVDWFSIHKVKGQGHTLESVLLPVCAYSITVL